MNILFICRFNKFRSKVAEGFFSKLNKNKKHKAKSAGLIRGSDTDKPIKSAAKEFDLKLKTKSQGLSSDLLRWHDIGIIVADDVPKEILCDSKKYGKKVRVWKVKDTHEDNDVEMRRLIALIGKKVEKLVKELKNK